MSALTFLAVTWFEWRITIRNSVAGESEDSLLNTPAKGVWRSRNVLQGSYR